MIDTYSVFAAARKAVEILPESVGRALFDAAGAIAGCLPLAGVTQLKKNYARVAPPGTDLRRAAIRGMRNYLRYYYEIFRLSVIPTENLDERVWLVDGEHMRASFAAGRPVPAALLHSGNWDLAGAWSEHYLAHVVTVAEKLKDERLVEGFVRFRQRLGMTIHLSVPGVFSTLVDDAHGATLLPLLADRDLRASGVTVRLCGHEAMVAAGPASLAQHTGEPLVPICIKHIRLDAATRKAAGTPWGLEVRAMGEIHPGAGPADPPEVRRADVERMCQEWMELIEPWLKENYEHWHMLQKVFVADLDRQRLARARQQMKEGA
ncbi:MAG: phosphatidylinositol mannoside acyltransferase [Flaviflexus sp.]|nr:phosphatidylinositol mannoside acyltransferase [Flaviflexus sp.]